MAASSPSPDAALSAAVLRYMGQGRSSFPGDDAEAVGDPAMADRARRLADEARNAPVDWAREDLSSATERVRRLMADRHPELTAEAIDALAWAFSYTWR